MRCEAFEAMNDYETIVKEIRMSDFNTFDEYPGVVGSRGDSDASAREDTLDLGAKG